MNRPTLIPQPPWTDAQLAEAISTSTNWRSVMLLLGFGDRSKSAGAVRKVRRRAAELNLDWSHFRGKRRWSDAQLKQAVAECHSWAELLSTLGLSARSGNVESHIKSHAVRLAATWFMLRGCTVSFPAEPARYDLLADTPQGLMRVQVKSTTSSNKYGWQVGVGHHPDTHSKKKR